jgi:hypothetical protein
MYFDLLKFDAFILVHFQKIKSIDLTPNTLFSVDQKGSAFALLLAVCRHLNLYRFNSKARAFDIS